MTFSVRVLMDSWGAFDIVIHRNGIAEPVLLIGEFEFGLLREEIEKQKKEFRTRKKAINLELNRKADSIAQREGGYEKV